MSFQILIWSLSLGANDGGKSRPLQRTNPQKATIYGMPIPGMPDKPKTVIVSKRSMAKGTAGIENEAFRLSKLPDCFSAMRKQTISTKVVELELKENVRGIYDLRMTIYETWNFENHWFRFFGLGPFFIFFFQFGSNLRFRHA